MWGAQSEQYYSIIILLQHLAWKWKGKKCQKPNDFFDLNSAMYQMQSNKKSYCETMEHWWHLFASYTHTADNRAQTHMKCNLCCVVLKFDPRPKTRIMQRVYNVFVNEHTLCVCCDGIRFYVCYSLIDFHNARSRCLCVCTYE